MSLRIGESGLARLRKTVCTIVDVKGNNVIVCAGEPLCLKFILGDDDKRLFTPFRWCYIGSTDDWFPLFNGPKPLSELARYYCPHIGEESFFELM